MVSRGTPVMRSTSRTRSAGTRSHCETAPRDSPSFSDSATTPPAPTAISLMLIGSMNNSLATLNNLRQATLNLADLDMLYFRRMSIGDRLRQLRKDKGLTQEQVGEICDVTKSMVSQWESDESTPATDRLILLRQKIDFSIDWLLLDGPAPRPQELALMKVAQKLPDYAVEKLTREGGSYAELIESAKSGQDNNHNNGTSG